MKPTIVDIAREAGVSIATVSKAIHNTGRMSEETRKKILTIMQDMNYRPNMMASALKGKSTYTVGLLIPDLSNPFSSEIARSVEDRGKELGYSVVMCNTDYDPEKEAWYISVLNQKRVDGIISASGFQNEDMLRDLVEQHIPIALITRDSKTIAVDTVTVDDFMGGYQATSYLIGLGHRRIGTIVLDLDNGRERLRGYKHALEEAGLPCDEKLILSGFTKEDGKEAAAKLMEYSEPPTAIVAGNDLLAIGVMLSAKERGIIIPDQLSVIGYDNTILAEITTPSLTTMNQPVGEMGRQVMDLLYQEITGKKKIKKRIVMAPELVIRESVKPPLS
ncbi:MULTISPECIES: LacI family DNA-binding transcriptional regulator [unclassified Paenibacillus]|uniref:LacI family DNA-binding transcriptional regulator n=1 Tax=unclassified Paenibacillus TaxID=185978 RepID=UPI00114452D0|nr:LacI family DNA-binding transcriptional regulator [Paenibacillus sp. tmac-D7]